MARRTASAPRSRTTNRIDLDTIRHAALEIADGRGLEAVTMRNLAEQLGVGVMSLYHYVKTKDELIEGLADLAIAELDIRVDPKRPWDEELERIGVAMHRALSDHPGAVQILLTRAGSPLSFVRAADKMLAMLLDAGLDRATAVQGLAIFQSFVVGHSVLDYSHSSADEYYGAGQPREDGNARLDVRPGLQVVIGHLRATLLEQASS